MTVMGTPLLPSGGSTPDNGLTLSSEMGMANDAEKGVGSL